MNELTIRDAELSDAVSLVKLIHQLGYSILPNAVGARIADLAESPFDRVLIAEADGDVSGILSMHLIPMFHASGYYGRITALVVLEAKRGQGIGTRLVEEAENWAWSQGCTKIEVTSGDHRTESHRFYESRGYRCDIRRFLKLKL
jgi:GNAT superfamily N-acetyltransferase